MVEVKKGKYVFGTVKVGERGQIVIPKEAREKFDIKPGDLVIVLGEEGKGIALAKADFIKSFALKFLAGADMRADLDEEGEEEEKTKGGKK
jgi:AbrB family looped-hinge helix DNA binding protein